MFGPQFKLAGSGGTQPSPKHHGEVSVSLHQPRLGVLQRGVVDGCLSAHHLLESLAIAVEVSQLERAVTLQDEGCGVVREALQLAAQASKASLSEDGRRGVREQLESGEPLLTVNDVPRVESDE